MDRSEMEFVKNYLTESLSAFQAFEADADLQRQMLEISDEITACFKAGHRLLIAGNGGSASDAQHMAGEFVSRLFFDHAPLPAIALTTDTSILTAVGNDYGYEHVFERQVLGLGTEGDLFLGISTSGTSKNVIAALHAAKQKKMRTIGFTGSKPGPMDELCEHVFHAPTPKTAVIQQLHITAVHLICGLVEKNIFPEQA